MPPPFLLVLIPGAHDKRSGQLQCCYIYIIIPFSKVGAVSLVMTSDVLFPYKVRAFGGKLSQKSSEAPVSGSPLMIHRSGSHLTWYERLA